MGARPWLLLLLPAGAYAVSYAILAVWHRRAWLLDAVVHESGRLTLGDTLLYAPHALGHLPVHVTSALAFAGAWKCFSPPCAPVAGRRVLAAILAAFLALCVWLSLARFGTEETLAFVLQRKQSDAVLGEGGAWSLHLPSTLTQILLVPLYVVALRALCGAPVEASWRGAPLFGAATLLLLAGMLWMGGEALARSVTSPRYLAHSAREMATFPITYYPLPAWLWLRAEAPLGIRRALPAAVRRALAACASLLLAALVYQSVVPIRVGIGALAQQPAFAAGRGLGIPYLLASHYFEHVLDTLFFLLVCLLATGAARRIGADGET
jgi:hypothetical protein